MEDQIRDIEKRDGLRLPFNIFPLRPTDTIPLSLLYTPATPLPTFLDYEPVFCFTCHSVINPYSEIDSKANSWSCIFCKRLNILPEHYRNLDTNLPIEFYDTTVEYVLNKEGGDPVYLFLIDVCNFDIERHDLMKEAVRSSFDLLPSDSLVCFIYFGTNIRICVFEDDCVDRGYLFSGKKEYTYEYLYKLFYDSSSVGVSVNKNGLNVSSSFVNKSVSNMSTSLVNKFFKPKRYFEGRMDKVVKNILRDPFPVNNGMRPLRCTGSAISLATSLFDVKDVGSKILLFTQGPCTFGPGSICSLSLKEGIRSHSDIIKGKSTLSKPAISFYTQIGTRMAKQGTSLDILGATIEDIGVYEMKVMSDLTGGMIIMAQDFDKQIYLSSIRKNMQSGFLFNSKMKIFTSPNLVFKGVLGQGISSNNIWSVNSLYPSTNLSILLEPLNAKQEELGYIQIVTTSQKNKKIVTRITTLARMFNDNKEKIGIGFDQEAGCVIQSRMYTFKNNFEDDIDLVRRIDRGLIRFVKKFASFNRDDSSSVNLPESMSFYPNFMYFLRRSVVVQSEGNSPDETSYYRNILGREGVTEAMTMIVPTLTSYHYSEGILPAEMDSKSLKPDTILLLDAFSNVLIWKGEHTMAWINEKLHEKEEYKTLKKCIDECSKRAKEIVSKRLPTPQFVETWVGESQERTLLSRVNPSRQGAVIATDDIDFETFYRCLCKIIVDS